MLQFSLFYFLGVVKESSWGKIWTNTDLFTNTKENDLQKKKEKKKEMKTKHTTYLTIKNIYLD